MVLYYKRLSVVSFSGFADVDSEIIIKLSTKM